MTQEQALTILKTGANVFLTGEPGSGKTHTVNQYGFYLQSHNIQPAITASTGIAATHLNGLTIHSWSGIGIKDNLSRDELEKISQTKYIVKRVAGAKVLIIDEISMLEAGTFVLVDLVCRKIRNSQKPFGGLQIIVVGDFFQLPPIGQQARFAFQSPVWEKADFTVCYLTEQFRQDDPIFLTMLSAIRSNGFTDNHLQTIQTRVIGLAQSPQDITRLFSHNADVDKINSQELAKLPGKAAIFQMSSRGQKNFVANLKRGCLSPEVLKLKVGACVMFTKNNIKEGFVNGTLGKVIGFNRETHYPIIQTTKGDKIEVSEMEWTVEENGNIRARIAQIPLRLAWAITIHKSQGMSLDTAVMDLQKTFEFGQGYVALSRVRRLSGLYLLGYNQKAFLTHPEMQQQDDFFRKQSQEAEANFAEILPEEIQKQQANFLLACGGDVNKKSFLETKIAKKEKISTSEITLALVKQGKNLAEIAKERGLTKGTVITHLENLVMREKVSQKELENLIDDKALLLAIPEICDIFRELETNKLQPIFERFNGQYSYNELRLARLFLT